MAGMTGHRPRGTSINSKATVPNAARRKGGQGAGGGQGIGTPPAPTGITYTWVAVAGNVRQTLLTMSQPVIWSGGIPAKWVLRVPNGGPLIVVNSGVLQISPTQWILTWSGTVNAATMNLTVPQLDPTFKGQQGQFLQAGTQLSGPQK